MKLGEVHGTLREGLATFEAFRNLGFAAGDVWVCVHLGGSPPNARVKSDNPWMNVQLAAQGREFTVAVGELPEGTGEESFEAMWREACGVFIAATTEERDELWEESRIRAHGLSLVWGLLDKGFRLPAVEARKGAGG